MESVENINEEDASLLRLPSRKVSNRSNPHGNSNSRGNKAKFQQQKRTRKNIRTNKLYATTAEEAVTSLQKLTGCCCPYFGGCIGKHFLIKDESGAEHVEVKTCMDYFITCRKIIDFKSEQEKRMIITTAFKDCIVNHRENQNRLKMNYILGPKKLSVCKKAFASAYATTVHALECSSKASKIEVNSEDVNISDYNVICKRKWKDGHIHDFTFLETQQLFEKNVYSLHKSADGITNFVSK